ncbi:hypothetical protein Daus18300_011230 [Diaporthe australafricana]|uniref:HET domain-containing protein n=1 Tax=Diaporthe australafricana TaxID=127596 RepID=A0ABR3W7P3_9PEZI
MWLIDTETLSLEYFLGKPPRYAILSHTWGPDEVTFADLHNHKNTKSDTKAGFHKIRLTCEQARVEGIRYAWVDTCCINKESSAELSEAINSMFKWYASAAICYAYLDDFPQSNVTADFSALTACRWFSRGWTLQELLAPRDLVFFAPHMGEWAEVGRKDTLARFLEQITRIPEDVLRQEKAVDGFSVAARMSWAAGRQTTREEDIVYCLMGLFDVNMPLLYGEGAKAFIRLQEEIVRETRDDSLFAWCSTEASAAKTPYRGLFASSPEEFTGSSDIKLDPIDGAEGTTSMMGNGRVSLSCSVRPFRDGIVIISLNCYSGEPFSTQGIYGVPTGNNTYLRSTPSKLAYGITGAVKNITIEKHVLRTEANTADNKVSRDDEIHLGILPRGFELKKVHYKSADRSTSNGSLTRVVPMRKVIGGKMAFEIEVETAQLTNIR